MASTEISDGLYFLHPEGSAWISARFRGGKLRASLEESMVGTHTAARDSWSNVAPSEDDVEISEGRSTAIVSAVMGHDIDPSLVVVTRRR